MMDIFLIQKNVFIVDIAIVFIGDKILKIKSIVYYVKRNQLLFQNDFNRHNVIGKIFTFRF